MSTLASLRQEVRSKITREEVLAALQALGFGLQLGLLGRQLGRGRDLEAAEPPSEAAAPELAEQRAVPAGSAGAR